MTDVSIGVHPDTALEAMLANDLHPVKKRNLMLIHQVCKERHALGTNDFSLKSVGNMVEARGGLKTKALWNAQSADYRRLIEAWQAHSGARTKKRTEPKPTTEETLTRSIADPATRIVIEQAIRERNALRAELNLVKAQSSITIDRRAMRTDKATAGSETRETGLLAPRFELNSLEREALEHAISSEHWESEGWAEEKHGRVVKAVKGSSRARTIFKPGFVGAIRKILGGS